MRSIVGPVARGRRPLTGRDHRGVPDQGDQVAMAAPLQTENGKAVLRVVEGDPLDEARENLGFWRSGTGPCNFRQMTFVLRLPCSKTLIKPIEPMRPM